MAASHRIQRQRPEQRRIPGKSEEGSSIPETNSSKTTLMLLLLTIPSTELTFEYLDAPKGQYTLGLIVGQSRVSSEETGRFKEKESAK
jgi:hypothetical protein